MQNLSFEFIFYTIKTGTIDASFVYTNLPPNNKGSTARFQIYLCAYYSDYYNSKKSKTANTKKSNSWT